MATRNRLMSVNPGVRIWRIARAPKSLRVLFAGAAEKNWIARTPPGFGVPVSEWLRLNWRMAYTVTASHQLPDGGMAFLGSLELDATILEVFGACQGRAAGAGSPG